MAGGIVSAVASGADRCARRCIGRAVAAAAVAVTLDWPALAAQDAHLLDAAWIGVQHLDLESRGTGHQLTAQGQPPDLAHDVAAEGVDLFGRVADVEGDADRGGDIVEARSRIGHERTVELAHHGGQFVLVVLVGDVADDLLDDILHRDEPVGAAVFVDHQRQVDAGRLHLFQEVERRHRRRHEQHLACDLRRGKLQRQVDGAEIESGGALLLAPRRLVGIDGGLGGHERDQVADVHHADRVVERVVVDDEPRVSGLLEHLHEFADRDVLLHGDDVAARHHDVLDPAPAQRQDVLDHGALFRRDAGFAGAGGFEHHLDVGPGRAVLPAEQRARDPREKAVAVGVGLPADRHRQVALIVQAVGRLSRTTGRIRVSHGAYQASRWAYGSGIARRARILRSSRSIVSASRSFSWS